MATHSSVLAWRIPGTGEPGGLTSMGSHRIRHDWSDLAAAAAHRLSLVAVSGHTHLWGAQALGSWLSGCGLQASLLHGMWNLPGPRIKPVSPALPGRFLATALPGKSPGYLIVMSGRIPKLTTKWFSSAAGGAKEVRTRALICLHTALPSSRQSRPPGAPLTLIHLARASVSPCRLSLTFSVKPPQSLSTWSASAFPSLSGPDLYGYGFTTAPASLQALCGAREALTIFGALKFSPGHDH